MTGLAVACTRPRTVPDKKKSIKCECGVTSTLQHAEVHGTCVGCRAPLPGYRTQAAKSEEGMRVIH